MPLAQPRPNKPGAARNHTFHACGIGTNLFKSWYLDQKFARIRNRKIARKTIAAHERCMCECRLIFSSLSFFCHKERSNLPSVSSVARISLLTPPLFIIIISFATEYTESTETVATSLCVLCGPNFPTKIPNQLFIMIFS
jgi:hypothetical protein